MVKTCTFWPLFTALQNLYAVKGLFLLCINSVRYFTYWSVLDISKTLFWIVNKKRCLLEMHGE